MRLLHLGDLHIGKIVNKINLLEDQYYALGKVIDRFTQDDIDGLLIAGDLYDTSCPSSEAVACVDWFISELSACNKPIFIISGNHDSPERISYASKLLAKQNVFVSPTYKGEIEHVVVEDEYGPLNVWLFPFVKPMHVRQYFPEVESGNYSQAFRVLIDSCNIDPSQRNIALVHQFIVGGADVPETSDSEMAQVGGLDNIDVSLFCDFDYVAMGHIHKSQAMGRKSCRYSGSLLKYSFSEANYIKEFPVVDIKEKGKDIEIEFFSFDPLRDMREIRGPIAEILSESVDGQNLDDYMHITLTDDYADYDDIHKLRLRYPNTMIIDFDNQSTRYEGKDIEFADITTKKSPLEYFGEFYQLTTGLELQEDQRELMSEIIDSVLGEDK